MMDIPTMSVDVSNNNHHQYGGGDDDHSLSSIGMRSVATKDNNFMSSESLLNATHGHKTNTNTNASDNNFVDTTNNNNTTEAEDAVTAEAENAVTTERQLLYKENAAKLQSVLENIKNSTKNILREMDKYLQETEEVEKTFIRCRANTQKESQRMEEVQPDVIAATQRFMAQGSQLFGGAAGAGGAMNFMNMMGATGGIPSNVGDSMMGMGIQPSAGGPGMMGTVTPRGNDGNASITGSSMAESMN